MLSFLVDENCLAFVPLLQRKNYKVVTPKDIKIKHDEKLVEYALKNNLVMITLDRGCAKRCRVAKVPCIYIEPKLIFHRIVLMMVKSLENGILTCTQCGSNYRFTNYCLQGLCPSCSVGF